MPFQTVSADYSQRFQTGKELKGKGYYDEAAKEFRRLFDIRPAGDAEIVIELADTLILQGYYESALECLEAYLRRNEKVQMQTNAALQMMCAFAHTHVTGKFKEALALVRRPQWSTLSADEAVWTDHLVRF